jgi:regulator of cell morphogenesis and NO signaling
MENEHTLKQVLERYSITDARLVTTFSELKGLDLDTNFIVTLLKMFEEEGSFPENELSQYPLELIVDYIARTHVYYLEKKLPEIEQSIELMLCNYADNHPLLIVLRNFYTHYRNHLTKHIQGEEKYILPHVRTLIKAVNHNCNPALLILEGANYSLTEFLATHTDTEEDLKHVYDVINQYSPPATNETPYRILLTQLQLLEKDLRVHAIIEDRVLIPRAIKVEKILLEKATLLSALN